MKFKINLDAVGITSSLACAIHCAVLPLLISSFSIFGVNIIENARFEYLMIFLAFGIGTIALYNGFIKHHRSFLPVIVFTGGMILLLAKQTWHTFQLWFLIPAVICILAAHFLNFILCKNDSHVQFKNGNKSL